jgi:hypothetical protein
VAVAGSAAMYHAMTSLGFAADSTYQGPIELSGDVRGTSVLILLGRLGRASSNRTIAEEGGLTKPRANNKT